MAISPYFRKLLGPGRFPRIEGQDVPDPVDKGRKDPLTPDQDRRDKALGLTRPKRPKPKKE